MNVKNFDKTIKRDGLVLYYLNDIKGDKTKPLTVEEERSLLKQYFNKNTTNEEKIKIKQKIVMSHQRFLYDMANCYANGDNDLLLELINIGTIGMYDTFDNFDLKKDNKFMTYAQFYVRRAITRFLNEENLIVRPSNNSKLTPKIKAIENEFYRLNGKKPTIFEIEDILNEKYNISLNDRNDLYGVTIERLETPQDTTRDMNSNFTVEKSKSFNNASSVENDFDIECEKEGTSYELNQIISKLTKRESTIIKMAFGIGDYFKPYNNIEIGEALHLTSERVRQLKNSAMEKLKSLYNYNQY